jgi:S1-C subfamily serine protease
METRNVVKPGPRSSNAIWVPPIILGAILSVFLIYLLLPGTLLYPLNTKAAIDIQEVYDVSKLEIENNLKQQISELERLSEEGICTSEGFVLPEGDIGLFPPSLDAEGQNKRKFSVLPPTTHLSNPGGSVQGNKSIADLLNSNVVLIANTQVNGESASGTGFFISEDLILTNQHVVEDAKNDTVEVAYPNSDDFFSAQLIKISKSFELGNQDYAVLRSNRRNSSYLKFANDLNNLNLMPVVSAGFPGDVMASLFEFDEDGSGLAFNGLPLYNTNGVINAIQPYNTGGALILHSAEISEGNSGGPLINGCGEIVGINTFIYNQPDTSIRTLNIALRSDGIKEFLDQSQLLYKQANDVCYPNILPLD